MEIDVNVSIIGSGEGVVLEVRDALSRCRIVRIELSHEKFCQMVMRSIAEEPCVATVGDLSKVGKRKVSDVLTFELPSGTGGLPREDVAAQLAKELCPDGWEPDCYFGSQGSFFYRDDKTFARCRIYRWEDAEPVRDTPAVQNGEG